MKKEVYTYPKSSFLSAEKDMSIIVNMIMENDRLKKMLYYTTKDCMNYLEYIFYDEIQKIQTTDSTN